MSKNDLSVKKARRVANYQRRQRAAKGVDILGREIPHQGIIVKKTEVKNHMYLKARGLEHSKRLASVVIKTTLRQDDRAVDLSPRKGFRSKAA